MCIITFYYTILVTRLARASFLSATFYFTDGEPLKLPESLESLPKSDHFPTQRHRWNTNEVSTFRLLKIHFQLNVFLLITGNWKSY